jgi:hypothetical protein
MPYSTQLIADGTGLYHEGSGTLTGEEMIGAAVATHSSPSMARALTHALVDLSGVDEFEVSPDDLRRLALENLLTAKLTPHALVAVVAPTDHVYGSVRMWEVFARDTGWRTEVFRDRADAERWLTEQLRAP